MSLTFGSLFSGIGGIDLGLQRAGMHCEWQVEKDAFCQKVLAKHWPNTPRYGDIRECGSHNLRPVDLVAGGFPCQPHSLAGRRQASSDERDLWPEFHRIIRELKPRWVLAENVLGLLSSESGSFFGGILRDLAQAGYDAEWCVLSAAEFGAPHLRERVFIVAHTRLGRDGWKEGTVSNRQRSTALSAGIRQWEGRAEMADTSRSGWQECRSTSITGTSGHAAWCNLAPGETGPVEDSTGRREWQYQESRGESRAQSLFEQSGSGNTQSLLGGMLNGLSSWLDRYQWPAGPGQAQHSWEPSRTKQGKVSHIGARLEKLGNAVVPQAAESIGRGIMEWESSQ